MPSYGPNVATANASSGIGWGFTGDTFCQTLNDTPGGNATYSPGNWGVVKTFGFTIPTDELVTSIDVSVRAYEATPATTGLLDVGLTIDGTTAAVALQRITTTDTYQTFPLSFGSLAVASVNGANFGVYMEEVTGSGPTGIDFISVTVNTRVATGGAIQENFTTYIPNFGIKEI